MLWCRNLCMARNICARVQLLSARVQLYDCAHKYYIKVYLYQR